MAQNVVTSGGNQPRNIASFVQFGLSRRKSAFQAAYGVFFAPLPDDPIGAHTLTVTNVVVGSRIAIRDQAKTTVFYDQIAAAPTVVIPLSVYASGSPLNDWLIDIRKASAAPFYQRYKTLMTAAPGASSLYINQLPDQR